MAILKSAVVGKALNDLPISSVSSLQDDGTTHKVWTEIYIKVIDFLSHCTLRHASSYGATYKIDPTSELTIIHTNGTRYPVASYEKLLTMVITDYDETAGATMPNNIRDYCVKIYYTPKALREKLHKALLFYDEPVDPRTSLTLTTTMQYDNFRFCPNEGIWYCTNTSGDTTNAISIEDFLTLLAASQEQPMSTQPQPGTHWERLVYRSPSAPKGEIIIVEQITARNISFSGSRDLNPEDFLENFKPRPDLDTQVSEPTQRRELAFYKESGKPWTEEELDNVRRYLDDTSNRHPMSVSTTKRKYVYWVDSDDDSDLKVYLWDDQVTPKSMIQTSYESVFETPITSTKTIKPEPVAQPEPIIPTPIKETFMSKLKETASTTVDQNKQALVIASKMEAGRIINKQVLKQLTPHLPYFFQGYAKSPFAPFVAANLVAMVANHTGNSKLTKVSDLMLLGAADSGVTAFNLDKIVDDILSNIKLPAGVLDDSDDE